MNAFDVALISAVCLTLIVSSCFAVGTACWRWGYRRGLADGIDATNKTFGSALNRPD